MELNTNAKEMTTEEELLLLGVLLCDVSQNWSEEIISRLSKANSLASKHQLHSLEEKISQILKEELENPCNQFDGRCFEGHYENYLSSDVLSNKSSLFKENVIELCTCPELIFEDWQAFK